MLKSIGKWLIVISLHYLQDSVATLHCFSCENQKDNWKCNEEEPVLCRESESCAVKEDSILWKGCGNECKNEPSRGDSPSVYCAQCGTDLCNSGRSSIESRPSGDDVLTHEASTEDGSKYILYAETLTFWEARMKCAKRKGVLANIHNKETEEFFIKSFINDPHAEGIMEVEPNTDRGRTADGAWIGLHRSLITKAGNYSWTWIDDGSVISHRANACGAKQQSYENWDNQANYGTALCGYVTRRGKWVPYSCGKHVSWYLCEYPPKIGSQSATVNDSIFTYKFSRIPGENVGLECDGNMTEVQPTEYLLNKFRYIHDVVINCGDEWCNESGVVKKERVPDRSYMHQYMFCQKSLPHECPFFANGLGQQTTPSYSQDTTDAFEVCAEFVYPVRNDSFTFGSVRTSSYAMSKETCPNGRPRALLWCTRNRSYIDFTQFPCEKDLIGTLSEISDESNYDPTKSLDEIRRLNLISLQQDDILSPTYLATLEKAIRSALNETKVGDMSGEAVTPLLDIISDLQEAIHGLSDARRKDVLSELSSDAKKYLVIALEDAAAVARINETRKEFSAEGVSVEVVTISGASPVESVTHDSGDSSPTIRVYPDSSILHTKSSGGMRVIFTIYQNDGLFPHDEEFQIDSVISATVTDGIQTYSVPVEFSFQTTDNVSQGICHRRECRYYDPTAEKWKRDGCRKTLETNDGYGLHTVTCTCDHTTSFAVVVSQQAQQNHALDIVSTLGLIACVVCLTLTIILFLKAPDLKRIRCGFIHINLCVCLDLSYLVFLIGIERTSNRYACLLTAAIIHFLLVSSWGWMGVESLTMYRMFVRPLSRKSVAESPKVAFAVYMISAAIVLVTLSFSVLAQYGGWGDSKGCSDDFWSSYIADGYCWLEGRSLYFGFLSIAFLTLIMNSVSAALIIKAITWRKAHVPNRSDEKPQIHMMRAFLIAMLLGLAWIFAIPLVVSDNTLVQELFGWLFALTTAFQGIFIFYFFCIRRKDVRNAWMTCLRQMLKTNKRRESGRDSSNGLRGARTESFLYLPNMSANDRTPSEETQRTTT